MKNKTNYIAIAVGALSISAIPLFAESSDKVTDVAGGSAAYEVTQSDLRADQAKTTNMQTRSMDADAAANASELQAQLDMIRKERGFNASALKSLNAYVSKHDGWGVPSNNEAAKNLPKGWDQDLGHGDVLPAAAYHAAQKLPKDVATKIPTPPGTEDILIEEKLFRIDSKSRVIIDMYTPSANIS